MVWAAATRDRKPTGSEVPLILLAVIALTAGCGAADKSGDSPAVASSTTWFAGPHPGAVAERPEGGMAADDEQSIGRRARRGWRAMRNASPATSGTRAACGIDARNHLSKSGLFGVQPGAFAEHLSRFVVTPQTSERQSVAETRIC